MHREVNDIVGLGRARSLFSLSFPSTTRRGGEESRHGWAASTRKIPSLSGVLKNPLFHVSDIIAQRCFGTAGKAGACAAARHRRAERAK